MRTIKIIIGILVAVVSYASVAQTRVTESVAVSGQQKVELDFAFADDIIIKAWNKNEVSVNVDVTINGGEDDHIFQLETKTASDVIRIELNKDMWESVSKERGGNCHWEQVLMYTVYLPSHMTLEASTIDGNYILEPYGKETTLKTISGDIDLTVKNGLDFTAKTISGEVYSDLNIEYPNGTEGLNQIVGMNITGRVSKGSPRMELETISGNIYLRKG